MFRVKRLVFSGLMAIMVVCLTIAGASITPSLEQIRTPIAAETGDGPVRVCTCPLPYPWRRSIVGDPWVTVNLTVSNFTEPVGVGSEAEINVVVESRCDISNVTIRIELSEAWPSIYPRGISFLDGSSSRSWIVDLQANVSISFTERIRAFETGFGTIEATARWWNATPFEKLINPCEILGNFSVISHYEYMKRILRYENITLENPPITPVVVRWNESVGILLHENLTRIYANHTISPPPPLRSLYSYESKDGCLVLVWNDGILVTKMPIPEPPVYLLIHLSDFTEPQSLGSEANLTVFLIPLVDMQNVSAQIILPEGLSFVSGNLTWNGDLKADSRMRLSAEIRVEKMGNWTIAIAAGKYLSNEPWFGDAEVYGVWWYGDAQVLGISVCDDEIMKWSGNHSLSPFPIGYHYRTYRQVYPGSKSYLEPVAIEWSTDSHNINDTFTLYVRVTNVRDMRTVQLRIKWDPAVLKFLDIEKGEYFLKTQGFYLWLHSAEKTDPVHSGYIIFGCAWGLGRVPGVNISAPESASLAAITFQVINFTEGTEICFVDDPKGFENYWIVSANGLDYDLSARPYDFEFMLPANFVFKKSTG